MKKHKSILTVLILVLLAESLSLRSYAKEYIPSVSNNYSTLRVPTQIVKINSSYFIVDSYHNQVIYNGGAGGKLTDWSLMDNRLNQPHAIASDGIVYMVMDTENNKVSIYEKGNVCFYKLQEFDNIGNRPHYVIYDEATGLFYAWSSTTGEMYLFRREQESTNVVLENVMQVPSLYGKYVRSFTIEGDLIYLPCVTSSSIVVVDRYTFEVKAEYPIPITMAGMNQITKIQNYFYITVSSDYNDDQKFATIIRTPSLEQLSMGCYENIYSKFGKDGVPYYISFFDNYYFMVVIRENGASCLYKFNIVEDNIQNIQKINY